MLTSSKIGRNRPGSINLEPPHPVHTKLLAWESYLRVANLKAFASWLNRGG
jgi:hypothetical protein